VPEEKKLIAICQRHGQTTLNAKKAYRGRLDPRLNDKGKEQAEDAADNLKNEGIKVERIISSPLLRAMETADIIAEAYDLPVTQDRGLLSFDVGFLGGKDKEDFGEILTYFIEHPKSVVPDGESLDDLEQRTFEFFEKELRSEKLTCFVSHNSNFVCLQNQIEGDKSGIPESDETSVKPGGTLGVYVDSEGKYSVEVLFGKEEAAAFGS
jgi:broad specificity phosphatase PhoE